MRESNLLVANLVLINIRELLLDEEKGMYERYAALFALRNDGGNEAVAAIIDSLGSKSALLKHEVRYVRSYFYK
jgi:deoxyhypusine monooxygenase